MFHKATKWTIYTEGSMTMNQETVRLAKGWLKAFTISKGQGVYTYEDGTKVTECSTQVTLTATCCSTSHLELLPVDAELAAEGRFQTVEQVKSLTDNYMICLATAIRDANGQECVLLERIDADGPAIMWV